MSKCIEHACGVLSLHRSLMTQEALRSPDGTISKAKARQLLTISQQEIAAFKGIAASTVASCCTRNVGLNQQTFFQQALEIYASLPSTASAGAKIKKALRERSCCRSDDALIDAL